MHSATGTWPVTRAAAPAPPPLPRSLLFNLAGGAWPVLRAGEADGMGSASEAESDDGEPERADEYRRGAVDELRRDGEEKQKDWANMVAGANWIAAGRHGEVFQVQGHDVAIKVSCCCATSPGGASPA